MTWQAEDEARKAKWQAMWEARRRVFIGAVQMANTVEDLRQVLVVVVNMLFRDNPRLADHLALGPITQEPPSGDEASRDLIREMEAAAAWAGEHALEAMPNDKGAGTR